MPPASFTLTAAALPAIKVFEFGPDIYLPDHQVQPTARAISQCSTPQYSQIRVWFPCRRRTYWINRIEKVVVGIDSVLRAERGAVTVTLLRRRAIESSPNPRK
jgi:hypothetical protein